MILKTLIAIHKENKRFKKMNKEFRINKLGFRAKAYIDEDIKKCEKLLSEENSKEFWEVIKDIGMRVFFDCYDENNVKKESEVK